MIHIKKEVSSLTYILATLFITFLIYSFSLNRGWQLFDERLFYQETLFPAPQTFKEIFEIFKEFGLQAHIESANTFFSNNITVRSAPLTWFFIILFSFFFKANPIPYHFIQLFIHLINTALVWLIFKNISTRLTTSKIQYFLISIFTLIWALHSTNTEAVMLATNWNALFAFTFCLLILMIVTKDLTGNNLTLSFKKGFLYCTLFLVALFFVEQIYTFPLILFFLVLIFCSKLSKSLKYSLPVFIGLFIYIIIYITSQKWGFKSISTGNESITAFIERNIWLTPQLFIHNLKLLFFPQTLSTYQSNLVHLSHSLISPYSISCLIVYLIFLTGPIILFGLIKRSPYRSYFLLPYLFLFSLIPFIHISFPTYCLSADRYLYFPSFYLILALFCITVLLSNSQKQKVIFTILMLVLFLMSSKTFLRTTNWKNSEALITSSINLKQDPLYKGHMHKVLATSFVQKDNLPQAKLEIKKSLKYLNKALKKYQALKEKTTKEPLTLLLYGLDYEALLLKTAYLITDIRLNFFNELGSEADLFKSLMEQRSNFASANEYALFIKLLLKNKEIERIKETLEEALSRYPGSSNILSLYIDFLFIDNLTSSELEKLIKRLNSLYPNRVDTLYKTLKYYSVLDKADKKAKYAYLIGLRTHDKKSYQLAAQTYLDLNDLKNAKKTLGKLEHMKAEDPFTLLLKGRYQFALKDYEGAYKTLQNAYTISKSNLNNEENANVYKGIVISLANVAIFLNDTESAKKYFNEYSRKEK